jgi:preprotein translocase subunit YajC
MFLITEALADGAATQVNAWASFLPIIAFVGILYFLSIRPQQKRTKQHQELMSSIKKGDKIITNSGIIATISKVVNEQEVVLEIANGVHCKFIKSAISNVIANEQIAETVQSNDNQNENIKKEVKTDSVSKKPIISKRNKKS